MSGLGLADLLYATRNDPDAFNDVFINDGKSFWSRQKEMSESVVKYRKTVVYSGNMIGKDYRIGRLIWWWLLPRPGSMVYVAARRDVAGLDHLEGSAAGNPALVGDRHSFRQREVSRGVKTSPQLVDLGDGWQAMGLSTTNVERARGHHNPHLLAVVDEASGIETDARDAIESLGYERLVAIGNPIRAEGRFVDLIRQAEADLRDNVPPHLAVNAIRIPSTDSPHAHLEKSPWGIADRTWIESCLQDLRW